MQLRLLCLILVLALASAARAEEPCWRTCLNNCTAKFGENIDVCMHQCNCTCVRECENVCLDFGLGPECFVKCGCFSGLSFGPKPIKAKSKSMVEVNIIDF